MSWITDMNYKQTHTAQTHFWPHLATQLSHTQNGFRTINWGHQALHTRLTYTRTRTDAETKTFGVQFLFWEHFIGFGISFWIRGKCGMQELMKCLGVVYNYLHSHFGTFARMHAYRCCRSRTTNQIQHGSWNECKELKLISFKPGATLNICLFAILFSGAEPSSEASPLHNCFATQDNIDPKVREANVLDMQQFKTNYFQKQLATN